MEIDFVYIFDFKNLASSEGGDLHMKILNFEEDFHNDPECSEFLEGIINQMQMEPLKHAKSLGDNLEKLIVRMKEEVIGPRP